MRSILEILIGGLENENSIYLEMILYLKYNVNTNKNGCPERTCDHENHMGASKGLAANQKNGASRGITTMEIMHWYHHLKKCVSSQDLPP